MVTPADTNSRRWMACGFAGVLSVVAYLVAIAISWPDTQLGYTLGVLVICAFPIFGIVVCYGLYNFIAAERDGFANRLAFVFEVAAFSTVLAMIIVQLAVGAGMAEIAKGLDEQTAKALRRGLRLVDSGLDVAWDFLGGVGFIFLGVAMRRRSGLGLAWTIPTVLLAAALIGLNAATFPWPPDTRGLFDIGPFVGLFFLVLSVRLIFLGRRAGAKAALPAEPNAAA